MELINRIKGALLGLTTSLGPWGLFPVAFVDSSFLSIPESTDLLIVTSAATNPDTAWLAVAMASLGSVAGCLVIYWIGVRGGEPLLVKMYGEERTRRAQATFERFEILALAVPAVLPPPAPFKIFVLAAGAFELSKRKFVLTILLARGLRYSFWAVIGVVYRDEARRMLESFIAWSARHLPALLAVFGLLLVAAAVYYWRVRRAAPDLTADAP